MPEPKRLPGWAITALVALIGMLASVASGLGIFVFTGLASQVDKTSDVVSRIEQRIAILEIRADTQEKFCRNKLPKGE